MERSEVELEELAVTYISEPDRALDSTCKHCPPPFLISDHPFLDSDSLHHLPSNSYMYARVSPITRHNTT